MSVADANRLSALEARIRALEELGHYEVDQRLIALEARLDDLHEQNAKLIQRIASLQGTLNAMRGRAVIPDAPVSHAASG